MNGLDLNNYDIALICRVHIVCFFIVLLVSITNKPFYCFRLTKKANFHLDIPPNMYPLSQTCKKLSRQF